MTKKLSSVEEVAKLDFVDSDDKKAFIGAMVSVNVDAVKKPIAKVYETKSIKQVRLYVYDVTCWKYLLFLTCDLVK